jgi:acetoin:2,6-dichlorophenolindophenol oxidoreductase subunit alpha
VYDAVARAVERGRSGTGPSLIEAHTIRWVGHFEGDGQAYRGKEEVAEGRSTDPIARLELHLTEHRLLDAAHAGRIRDGVRAEIDDAVEYAEASPLPQPQDALTDLYAHWPWRE